MNDIEAIGKAIREAARKGGHLDGFWDRVARAAYLETLRQIREPGRGALCAAATHDGWLPVTDESAHIIRMEDIKYDWQAMIDHLIAEAESE